MDRCEISVSLGFWCSKMISFSKTALLFIFYSVLGPALTFRISHNPRNVSTADLVQVAGKSIADNFFSSFVTSPVTQQHRQQASLRFISFSLSRPLCHRLRFGKWEHRLESPDTVDSPLFILFRQTPVPQKIINSVWWQMTINYWDDESGVHTCTVYTHIHAHKQRAGCFIWTSIMSNILTGWNRSAPANH